MVVSSENPSQSPGARAASGAKFQVAFLIESGIRQPAGGPAGHVGQPDA